MRARAQLADETPDSFAPQFPASVGQARYAAPYTDAPSSAFPLLLRDKSEKSSTRTRAGARTDTRSRCQTLFRAASAAIAVLLPRILYRVSFFYIPAHIYSLLLFVVVKRRWFNRLKGGTKLTIKLKLSCFISRMLAFSHFEYAFTRTVPRYWIKTNVL